MDEQTQWIVGLSITLFLGLSAAIGMYLMGIYNSADRKRIREHENHKKTMEKEKHDLNKLNLDGIEIVKFADYYFHRVNTEYLIKEYKAVMNRYIPKTINAKALANESKNLCNKYVPYDHNMVDVGKSKKKYVNASWMPGSRGDQHFIATQIPLKSTISDFWNMIKSKKCNIIVMIGEEVSTSAEIFNYIDPKAYENQTCPFRIEIEKELLAMNFRIQTLRLFEGQESRSITHIQFLSWSNIRTTKPQVILELRRLMKNAEESLGGPIIVHCVSGCGRTGTFIAICNLCDLVDKYKKDRENLKISVPLEVIRMKESRVLSVANVAQYKIVYDAIIQYVVAGVTSIPVARLHEEMLTLSINSTTLGVTKFQRQFENTIKMTYPLQLAECAGGIRDENIDKNRDPLIVPRDCERPYLKNVRLKDTSDYINAVYIDSFVVKNHFIIAQWPKKNTINDIWRLLFDKNIQVMVLLNVFENSKKYPRFWPTILNQKTGSGPISVELIEDHMISQNIRCQIFNLAMINFEIKSSDISLLQSKGVNIKKRYLGDKVSLQVAIFHLLNWKNDNHVPDQLQDVINLIWLTEEFNSSSGFSATSRSPIVLMSEDGVKRAGAYCVVAACLERMRLCGDVDVYSAVMNVKRNRPPLIPNLEEYLLCYELCLEYLHWSDHEEDMVQGIGIGN